MKKKISTDIKESEEVLKKKLLNSRGKLKRDRIKTLLYIKKNKYYFQCDIARELGRTEKTIRGWILEYSKNGYTSLLKVKIGGNNTRTISKKTIKLISKAIKFCSEKKWDPYSIEISSFFKLKSLIEESHGEKIDYHAFYSYFRRNYKEEFKLLREMFSEKRAIKAMSRRSKKQIKRYLAEFGLDDTILFDEP